MRWDRILSKEDGLNNGRKISSLITGGKAEVVGGEKKMQMG